MSAAPARLMKRMSPQTTAVASPTKKKRKVAAMIMKKPIIMILFSPEYLSARRPAGISSNTNARSMKLKIQPIVSQEYPRN